MTIGWCIVHWWIMLFETEHLIEIAHQFFIKGFLIVSDYVPWYPVLIDDITSNEVYYSFFLHFFKWHNFRSFRKIIYHCQYVSIPSKGFRSNGSNHVKSLYIKWSQRNWKMEWLKGMVYKIWMELAWLTLLSIFHAILNHSWPIVTHPFDSKMNTLTLIGEPHKFRNELLQLLDLFFIFLGIEEVPHWMSHDKVFFFVVNEAWTSILYFCLTP